MRYGISCLLIIGSVVWTPLLRSSEPPARVTTLRDITGPASFSPDGKILVIQSKKGMTLWDTKTWEEKITLENAIRSPIFGPDSKIAASISYSEIRVWDVTSGKIVSSLESNKGAIFPLAFSPDGKILAVAHLDEAATATEGKFGEIIVSGETILFDVAAEKQRSLPDAKKLPIVKVHADWDGRFQPADLEKKLTEAAKGKVQLQFQLKFKLFAPLRTVSGDGQIVASAIALETLSFRYLFCSDRHDSKIELFYTTPEEHLLLTGHRRGISALAFARDNRVLASGDEGGTVKLWDVLAKKELASFRGCWTTVGHLTFSPDGSLLIVGTPGDAALLELRVLDVSKVGKDKK